MSTFIIKNTVLLEVICVFKENDNQYIEHRPMTNLDFSFKNIKIRCTFPQILEMRITFDSCREFMTYRYYKKQPIPTCEIRLNQHLARNPKLISLFNVLKRYRYIQKYAIISEE